MKVLYDLTSAQSSGGTIINGGGEYSLILFEALAPTLSADCEIYIVTSKKRKSDERIKKIIKEHKSIEYNNIQEFAKCINEIGYDVVIFPVLYPNYSKMKIIDSIKIIGGIHDLSIIFSARLGVQPGRIYKQSVFNSVRYIWFTISGRSIEKKSIKEHSALFSINNNMYIYTVSYFSKAAIKYYLGKNLDVYYSHLKECIMSNENDVDIINKNNLAVDMYFMLVSANRWTKNTYRAMLAIDRLISAKKIPTGMKALVLGCDKQHCKFFANHLKNKENFIFMGYVSEKELDIFYKNAHVFIYPSLVEGFGYPPIEAMKRGTLCLCSTYTSIPEICGDAVIYFDPRDITAIEIAIIESFDMRCTHEMKRKSALHAKDIADKQNEDFKRLIGTIRTFLASF